MSTSDPRPFVEHVFNSVQSDVGQQRGDHSALRSPHVRGGEYLPGEDSRLQPTLNHSAKDRCPGKDDVMVNLVEEAFDVGVQNPAASCPLGMVPPTFASQTM